MTNFMNMLKFLVNLYKYPFLILFYIKTKYLINKNQLLPKIIPAANPIAS